MGIVRIGKLVLFYCIFYTVLASCFCAMMIYFLNTLDDTAPKLQLDSSLIGSNPGLTLRPTASDYYGGNTLIWYNASDKRIIKYWQSELDTLLEPYLKETTLDTVQNCDNKNHPDENKVCEFKLKEWFAPCLNSYGYGFESENGGPCIFLKLNKIFGWKPEYYNTSTAPNELPNYLKEQILENENKGLHHLVWVDCVGENAADVENIGAISYHPYRGFHEKYFPFTNIEGYLSPLVAVRFENPKRGVLINIECKAWARNIYHDRVNRRGSVHFELMIND